MPSTKPLRVLVADDHPIFLDGVRTLLKSSNGVELVGEAGTGPDALRLILNLEPVVAVLDVSMPGMSGIAVIAQARSVGCPTLPLVLSMHEERVFIQQALAAGARGYLLKRSATDSLVHAVRAIAAGGLFLDPSVAGRHLGSSADDGHEPWHLSAASRLALTKREADAVRLVAHGFTSREIGHRLGITSKSVETHKARAAAKLGIAGRAKLVEYALLQGWLDPMEH